MWHNILRLWLQLFCSVFSKIYTMIFQYQKTRKVIEALGDLMKIHIDRIAGYQSALELSGAQPSQEEMIRNIIKEGLTHKQELAQQIQQMNAEAVRGAIIYGKMYQVWMDLKVKFAGGSRKSIIASCRYNEEIVLHVYNV